MAVYLTVVIITIYDIHLLIVVKLKPFYLIWFADVKCFNGQNDVPFFDFIVSEDFIFDMILTCIPYKNFKNFMFVFLSP